jgi:hypothetical protein
MEPPVAMPKYDEIEPKVQLRPFTCGAAGPEPCEPSGGGRGVGGGGREDAPMRSLRARAWRGDGA